MSSTSRPVPGPAASAWVGIDHVQLAIPAGGIEPAREVDDDEIPGTVRCHLADPFGNRIELVEVG